MPLSVGDHLGTCEILVPIDTGGVDEAHKGAAHKGAARNWRIIIAHAPATMPIEEAMNFQQRVRPIT
jgi:hypothetical protein